jgi:hypothetical protein
MADIGDDVNSGYDELDVEELEYYESGYEFIDTYTIALAADGYSMDDQQAVAEMLEKAFGSGHDDPNHSEQDRNAAIELLAAEYDFGWDWDAWRKDMGYDS